MQVTCAQLQHRHERARAQWGGWGEDFIAGGPKNLLAHSWPAVSP